MGDFEGKVVLVTGAGRGAGRAIARAFAAEGAILAVNDISPINLDETVTNIQGAGGQVKDYIFDIAKRLPARALMEEVLEDWGRLDILVHHANVRPRASILEMDEWDWQRTLDVNLSGALYLMQPAGRAMREQDGGVIILIGSNAQAGPDFTGQAAYLTSNSGLIGLSREAAREFAAYNIRVNMICTTPTPGSRYPDPEQAEDVQKAAQESTAALRSARHAEVSEVVLFLCSSSAARITGQVFQVGGGYQVP